MNKESFDAVCQSLAGADVPFIIVGGVAVIHHGYGRMTQNLDLVIRLEQSVIRRAFAALEAIGYRPSLPITADDFADPDKRRSWQEEKGMRVLKFWSDRHRRRADKPLTAPAPATSVPGWKTGSA